MPPSFPMEGEKVKIKNHEARIFQMQESMANNRSGLKAGPGATTIHTALPGSSPVKWGAAPWIRQTCSSGSHGWWVSWWHLCTSPSSDSWEMPNLLTSFTPRELLSFDRKNLKIRSFSLHHPRQMEMHSLVQVLLKVYTTLDSSQCLCLNSFLEP